MDFFDYDREIGNDDLNRYNYPNTRVGVIVEVIDDKGRILLQQRGNKSYDEHGLYEQVGGKYESSDSNFRNAIIREMKEEMGEDVVIRLSNSLGIYHVYKNNINWLFVVYLGEYVSGEIKSMEPDKCMGYKFFDYEELLSNDLVTDSCKVLSKYLKQRR